MAHLTCRRPEIPVRVPKTYLPVPVSRHRRRLISADTCSEQGGDLVAAFLNAQDPDEEVLAVNEAFAVPLIDAAGEVLEAPMVGELDCRVRKDGRALIVDWKTSARRWPKGQADKSLQPTVYLFCVSCTRQLRFLRYR